MKKIISGLALVSSLSLAGGTIGNINMDQVIEQNDLNNADQNVNVAPLKTTKKELKKEVLPVTVTTPKFYVGASIALGQIDTENNTEIIKNSHPVAAIVKIGYNVMDNLAIEGRAGGGVKEDKISFTKNKITSIVAAYVKPNVNVSKNINLFGLLGYAKTKMEQQVLTSDVSSISYGAGLSYMLNSNLSMVGDLVRYGKKGNHTVDTASLGLEYAF